MKNKPRIEPFSPGHAKVIADIYRHYVKTTAITFDMEGPSTNEMAQKLEGFIKAGYPVLTALTDDNTIIGYAYASPYRTKKAYQHSTEITIYLHPDHLGGGAGTCLLQALLDRLKAIPQFHLAIAIIADEAKPSIGLHKKLGFKQAGYLAEVGYKFGRWHGTITMSKIL